LLVKEGLQLTALLDIQQVDKIYGSGSNKVRAVNQVTLTIHQGETVGLVGESGSGKSTLGKMLVGLEVPTAGVIQYAGKSLWGHRKFKRPHPGEIQTVFQDPQSSLDPRMKIKSIILEPLHALRLSQRRQKGNQHRFLTLINKVGLKEEQMNRYSYEFSGGQRQRIAIARALITDPSFVVLDEPTSALDVSVQAEVLNLLKKLKVGTKLTYLFISHNMSVIRYMCDRIAVMYKGTIVEMGPAQAVFDHPRHPYTKILLSALPQVHQAIKQPLTFAEPKDGGEAACIFFDKCPYRQNKCRRAPHFRKEKELNHGFACHFYFHG
jgi:peptide/nickel transport system ATP-binding protein/oligopeptide transport system ATP-binding protein